MAENPHSGVKARRNPVRIVVAVVLLCTCPVLVYLGLERLAKSRAEIAIIDHAAKTHPLEMKVDLSKKGIYKDTLENTFVSEHGLFIVFMCPDLDGQDKEEKIKQLLAGFAGHITVTDPTGVVGDEYFSAESFEAVKNRAKPRTVISYTHPPVRGTVAVTLTVNEPALAMAGKQQSLAVEYFLCGLEYTGPALGKALGIAEFVLAGVLALAAIWIGLGRKRNASRRRPTRTSPKSPGPVGD